MKTLCATLVLAIAVSLFCGCADNETPTAPPRLVPEFTATIAIDSCESYPPGQPLDDLCGRSDIHGSFDFAYAGVEEQYTGGDYVTRVVTLKTGPGTWEFSRHGCTRSACRLGDALHTLFAGRPLTIIVRRSTSSNDSATVMNAYVVAGNPSAAYALSFLVLDAAEIPVDAAGFPVIDGDLTLRGGVSMGMRYGTAVGGSAEVTIKDWDMLPVHHKTEPPVVARPALAVQDLRQAPETLALGDYELAFDLSRVFRPVGHGVTVEFAIWEQGLWDVDQARLDFVWVVHESGDVWEPEIPSVWDRFQMEESVRDGPAWDVGTQVDVVAGFVDLDGNVQLMRSAVTIE